jgi:hypothetical protein
MAAVRRSLAAMVAAIALLSCGEVGPKSTLDRPPTSAETSRATTATSVVDPTIEALITGAGMTARGRQLFLAAVPRVEDAATLAATCAPVNASARDGTAHTFGCLVNGRIHVRSFTAPELAELSYAVAAHELLHVVYLQLPSAERVRLDADLAAARAGNTVLEERLKVYAATSDDTLNEVHSVLGTEFPSVSPALEAHYARFIDRARVVAAYQRTLGARDDEIRRLRAAIAVSVERLHALDVELSNLRAANDIRGYNAKVASYNAVVAEHNANIDALRDLVEEQNRVTAS